MLAYREISDDDLFTTQLVKAELVKAELPLEEFPGYKAERIVCEVCGEGISFCREARHGEKVLRRGLC